MLIARRNFVVTNSCNKSDNIKLFLGGEVFYTLKNKYSRDVFDFTLSLKYNEAKNILKLTFWRS